MARKSPDESRRESPDSPASSSVEELLLAALERGDESLETGRYLVTFKEGAAEEGLQSLGAQAGMRVANARDFEGQAATLEDVGDADALVFPEIGVALLGGAAAQERGMGAYADIAADSPIESIDPEYFMFPAGDPTQSLRGLGQVVAPGDPTQSLQGGLVTTTETNTSEFLRGFAAAAETIVRGLGQLPQPELEDEAQAMVLGATWGLTACKVPPSPRTGAGIRVAVLDTGFDFGRRPPAGFIHPDFVGRPIVTKTFVGQPIWDTHGHGTHVTGTACGPKAPAGTTPRYGIGYRAPIFVGKVLVPPGPQAAVLAGIEWAIANKCPVINMSLGVQITSPHPAYTAAGRAALNNGCLIIAAAGNQASNTGQPANSPTIMSVASLDPNLKPSAFSNFGKIDIAGPGRDVFSSWLRPPRYNVISGTSMAAPHVAGCAALWAESSPSLRGINLWRKLQTTAKKLPPLPPMRVGAGLVQAP